MVSVETTSAFLNTVCLNEVYWGPLDTRENCLIFFLGVRFVLTALILPDVDFPNLTLY